MTFICIGLQIIVSFLSEEEMGGGKGHMGRLSINCEYLSIGCAAGFGSLSSAALQRRDNHCVINPLAQHHHRGTCKFKDSGTEAAKRPHLITVVGSICCWVGKVGSGDLAFEAGFAFQKVK